MKVVFDSNVIISALVTHGLASRVFDICLDEHSLLISDWIINEVTEKLEVKFNIKHGETKRVKSYLNKAFIKVDPAGVRPDVCRDKEDNNLLHLAEFAKADVIITGIEVYNITNCYSGYEGLTFKDISRCIYANRSSSSSNLNR